MTFECLRQNGDVGGSRRGREDRRRLGVQFSEPRGVLGELQHVPLVGKLGRLPLALEPFALGGAEQDGEIAALEDVLPRGPIDLVRHVSPRSGGVVRPRR